MAGNATLEQIRALPTVVYKAHSVITGNGGPDGSITSEDGELRYALDFYTPKENAGASKVPQTPGWAEDHVIVTATEEVTHELVIASVTLWCIDRLGHDRVTFVGVDTGE